MRFAMLAAAFGAMCLAVPAHAQALWTFDVTVYATGTKTIAGSSTTPFSGYFTFQRHYFAFNGIQSVQNLGGSFDDPHADPLGLAPFLGGLGGTFTLGGGGSNFSYISSTCRSGAPGCIDYFLSAPTFSVAFVSSSNGPGPVPEPTTWAMMIVGIGGIAAALRRRGMAGKLDNLLLNQGI